MTFIEQIKAEIAAGWINDRRIERLILELDRLQAALRQAQDERDRLQAELLSLRVMIDRLAEARTILLASRPEVPLSSIEGFIEGRSD